MSQQLYQQQNLGDSISQVVSFDDRQDEAIRTLERGSTAPGVLAPGVRWISTNSTTISNAAPAGALVGTHNEAILLWNGTAWKYLEDVRHPQLNAGGTVAMVAALNLGGQRIENMAAGTANSHAVRRDQVVLRDGSQGLTAHWNVGGYRLQGLGAPVDPNDAVRLADLGNTAGMAKGALFQNSDGGELFSKNPAGGPNSTVVHRLAQTTFRPRRVRGMIKARLRDSTDFTDRGLISATFDVAAWAPQADNGATFTALHGGTINTQGGPVALTWECAPALVGVLGGTVYRSNTFTSGGRSMRLFVEVHVGTFNYGGITNGTGVEFYCKREDNGEYLEFDEYGGGGAGVLQLMVEGWD